MKILRSRFTFAILILGLSSAALAQGHVAITFEENAVIAQVTPGATTVWFSVAHEFENRGLKLVKRAFILDDADGNGLIQLPLPGGLAPSSLWMVVDLSSGNYEVRSPGVVDGHLRRRALSSAALSSSVQGGAATRLQLDHSLMTFFVVRPGVGAWFGHVRDGSAGDTPGIVDGKVDVLLETLQPIGNSPPAPGVFLEDDVVACVEPLSLSISDGRVTE